MDKYSKDKLHLLKIKSAISQFILNTQKLVQSVEPKAEIIIPSELPKKRPRSSLKDQLDHSYHITVPNYKKIKKIEVSENSSSEDTDDEYYASLHKPREKLEILLRTCPELAKIKSGDCSTRGIHKNMRTAENLLENLSAFKRNVGSVAENYYEGLLKLIPWPKKKYEKTLVIRLP